MIATVLTTLALAGLAMLPGVFLMRGSRALVGQWAAAATASLVGTQLLSALIGEVAEWTGGGQLPAATFAVVSLAASLLAWWITRGRAWSTERLEWEGGALAAAFVAFGMFALDFAMKPSSDGGLLIHSWYNADWFKHLGHVYALADYGLPARDIFGNGGPLHYYWLSYILPGAGAALGGDGWAALAATNAIITALFCFTFYGAARMACDSRYLALIVTFLGLFVTAPPGFFVQSLFGMGFEALLALPTAPKGPALMALAMFIPQHTLTMTMLLSWALLHRPDSLAPQSVRLLALISLACAMVLSTLLGAMLLAAYGLTLLWQRQLRAATELVPMAVAAGGLVVVLGVLALGNPDSALESPLFTNEVDPGPWFVRAARSIVLLMSMVGVPLLAALFVVRFWKDQEPASRFVRVLAICLIVAAVACVALTEITTPPRIAVETLIRAVIPAGVGVALIGAWALAEAQRRQVNERRLAWAAVFAMTLIALPCVYVRVAWTARFDDTYTTLIPADDLRVLSYLREESRPRETVWQYPEAPVLANPPGQDVWASVIAGRTVLNSQRATDYAAVAGFIETSKLFFAGKPAVIPPQADWTYLSRILHPETYDPLVLRMKADRGWRVRACYPDACLFSRVKRAAAQ